MSERTAGSARPDRIAGSERGAAPARPPAGELRMGVFGSEGSFTEEAGRAYAEREGLACAIEFRVDPGELLRAVDEGRVDLGVLPVMNSVGGLVRASFEAMGRHPFEPVGQIGVAIRHCLLARPGTKAEAITDVVSHPQALVQCERYLARHLAGAACRPWNDTGSAARDLARGELPATTAVLASRRAAERFGLAVLAEDVQDAADNLTTFVVFARADRRAEDGP